MRGFPTVYIFKWDLATHAVVIPAESKHTPYPLTVNVHRPQLKPHTHTHTQHLCPWVLQYFKIAAKWEKRPLSLPQWAYSEAAPKATYLPKYVSTFLICIIYYGQNQNREHSQGQYYVLALWLLLNRTPVSWIHTNTHSRTISDTCLHTRFAPTGPLPEKHGCYGKRTTIQSLFTQH